MSGLQPPAVAAVPPADMWSEWRDLNSRPSDPKSDALAKLSYAPILLVDLVGLEPTLPCLQGRCFPSKLQAHMVLQTGLEPEPSVWKTDMLGHYTNATNIIAGRIDRT